MVPHAQGELWNGIDIRHVKRRHSMSAVAVRAGISQKSPA